MTSYELWRGTDGTLAGNREVGELHVAERVVELYQGGSGLIWAEEIPAPTGVSGTMIDHETIRLEHTPADPELVEESIAYYRAGASMAGDPVANSDGIVVLDDTDGITDHTPLNSSTEYFYIFASRRYGVAGEDLSAEVSATTDADLDQVTGLTAVAVSHQAIDLDWNAVTGATGYEYRQKKSSSGTWGSPVDVGNVLSHRATGLDDDTSYDFQVRAYDGVGFGDWSATASATTEASVPAKVTGLTADAETSTQISLDWNAASGATGYEYRFRESGGVFGSPVSVGGSTSALVGGLDPSTSYDFQARGTNSAGDGDWSDTETESTLARLSAPANFSATAQDVDAIDLDWDAVTGAAGYEWRRDGGAWQDVGTSTSATDTDGGSGLTPGTAYSYDVRAYETHAGVDSPGNSSADSATTLNLDTPSGVTATRDAGSPFSQINVAWTDASNGEDEFVVQRSLTGTGGWSVISTPASSPYEDDGLTDATRYHYRVAARRTTPRGTYTGAYSSSDDATTDILAPTSLTAELSSWDEIQLEWTDNSQGNDGYDVLRATGQTAPEDDGDYTVIAQIGDANSYLDTGLDANTEYHYRVRATASATSQTSATSNTASQETGDSTPEVTGTTILDTSGGGIFSAGGTYDVDLDTESVEIHFAEYDEDHIVVDSDLHAAVNVTPGSNGNQIPDYTTAECHYVEFTVTPYTLDDQGGSSGDAVDTGEVRVGNGSCPP